MATIHITEAEAARDLPSLLARVRAGAEVVIDQEAEAAVMLRTLPEPATRRLSESLRLARQHGSTATLDSRFAHDLEAIVESHAAPLRDVLTA